jgi:hypothetical protein
MNEYVSKFKKVETLTPSGGEVTVDLFAQFSDYYFTFDDDIDVILTNITAGNEARLRIYNSDNNPQDLDFPSSIKWAGGELSTVPAEAEVIVSLWCISGSELRGVYSAVDL